MLQYNRACGILYIRYEIKKKRVGIKMFDKIESVVEGQEATKVGLAQDMGYSNETIIVEAVRLTLSALGKAAGALCRATNNVRIVIGSSEKTAIEVYTERNGHGGLQLNMVLTSADVTTHHYVDLNVVGYSEYEPKVQVKSNKRIAQISRSNNRRAIKKALASQKIVDVNLYNQIVVITSDNNSVQSLVKDHLSNFKKDGE